VKQKLCDSCFAKVEPALCGSLVAPSAAATKACASRSKPPGLQLPDLSNGSSASPAETFDTVDGRNPAPPMTHQSPIIYGVSATTNHVDCHNHRYLRCFWSTICHQPTNKPLCHTECDFNNRCRISSINSMSACDNEYDGFYLITRVDEDFAMISGQFLERPGPVESNTHTENIEHYGMDAKAAAANGDSVADIVEDEGEDDEQEQDDEEEKLNSEENEGNGEWESCARSGNAKYGKGQDVPANALVAVAMSCDVNAAKESTQCKECVEVAATLVTYGGSDLVPTCKLEELGRQEPAPNTAFRCTSASIKASALDLTTVEGPVPATPTAVHGPPADDTAAATDAATDPAAPAIPRLIQSLSSPAVLCHTGQVEAPVVPEGTLRPHRERTTSIGCPAELLLQRKGSTLLQELDVAAHGSQVTDLERTLAVCEQQLEEIEHRAQALRVMTVNSCEAAGAAGECAPCDVEAASLRLSRDFEELAAEALELGCRRVPGAMDIFEQANIAIDCIASCLRHCRKMKASAKGAWPPAHAKGPAVQAVSEAEAPFSRTRVV